MQDSKLDTGRIYVKDIFGNEQFYNIPEYQRPYVWGEEQINNFLDDINNSFSSDVNKEYFLGCMIWNTKNVLSDNGTQYKTQDILDGQQRFLTLFLLHVVIRNLSNDEETKSGIQEKLVQKGKKIDKIPQRNRIYFDIREDKKFIDDFLIKEIDLNNEILEKVINNHNYGTSVRNLAKGLKIMFKWFDAKKIEYKDSFQEYLENYLSYLSTKVLALYLATPNNLDDAYNLFTVLNSRGLQLQASDILRAQNLRVIEDGNTRKKYAEKWDDFENKISFPLTSVDDVLWIVVESILKYNGDETKTLKKSFDHIYKKGSLSKGAATIDLIEQYLQNFIEISQIPYCRETGNLFANIFNILNHTFGLAHIMPIIYFKDKLGLTHLLDFLIKLDNLYSIPWLMGRRLQKSRTYIILRKIDELHERIEKKEITKDEASKLMINDNCLKYDFTEEKYLEKPLDLEIFEQYLLNESWGAYSGTKVNKTRYLLLKLDLLFGSRNNVLHFNKSQSSIEHLMPQKIENTVWNIDADFHKEWLHRLGNLVLLDRNKNSSMSNSPYNNKYEKYKGAIESRAYTNHIFMNYKEWNEYTIIDNHEILVKLLMDYYRGNSVETFLEIQRNLSKYNPKQFV